MLEIFKIELRETKKWLRENGDGKTYKFLFSSLGFLTNFKMRMIF